MKHLLLTLIVSVLGHCAFAQCVITSQPASVSLCEGANTSFSCTTSGGGLTYTWQISTNGGGSYSNITVNSTYSGANTSTLSISGTTVSMYGYKYRVNISGACGIASSNSATLTVYPIPATPVISSTLTSGTGRDTFCRNISFTLYAFTSTIGAATYIWNGPNSYTSTQTVGSGYPATFSLSSPQYSHSGIYDVTVIINGCNSIAVHDTIVVSDPPNTPSLSNNSPLCDGDTLKLYAQTTSPGAKYKWSGPGCVTPFYSYEEDPVKANAIQCDEGLYFVQSYYGNVYGGCYSSAATTFVKLNRRPANPTTPANSLSVCRSNLLTFQMYAANNVSYRWDHYPAGGSVNPFVNSQVISVPNLQFADSGYYYGRTYIDTEGMRCYSVLADTVHVAVHPNPPPAVITASGPTTFCEGGSVLLNANTGPGYSYIWHAGSATVAIASNYVVTTSGSYTVSVSDTFGCVTSSNPSVITVNPKPVAVITAAGPTILCLGGSVTLNANVSAGLTYQWYNSGVISGPPGGMSSYTAVTYGDHYVEETTSSNCKDTSNTITAIIVVQPPGLYVDPSNHSVCLGNTATFQVPPSLAYFSYQWSVDTGSGFNAINGAGGYALYVNNTTAAMNGYRYKCTVTGACRPDTSDIAILTVHPRPPAVITASGPTAFCQGGSVLLNANTGPGYTYVWYRNGSLTSFGSNYSAFIPSSYTVLVIDTLGCSSISNFVIVIVNPKPGSVITAAGPTAICLGGNVTLNANLSAGLTYLWYKNGVLSGAPGGTSSYTAGTYGDYYVEETTSENCRDTSNTITIAAVPIPTINNTLINDSDCTGGTVSFKVNATGSSLNYQWQENSGAGWTNITNGGMYSGAGTDSLGISGITYTINNRTYHCVVSNACALSTISNAAALIMAPQPLTAVNMNYRPDNSVEFSVTTTCTNCSYAWAPLSAFASFSPPLIIDTPGGSGCAYLSTNGPGYCPVTLGPFCYNMPHCGSKTAAFTISPNWLTATFNNTATAPDNNQVLSYIWNFGDGSTDTVKNPTHTYAISGTYSIVLITWWMDKVTYSPQCADTTYASVSLGNIIRGFISIDTVSMNPVNPVFKIWLIHLDSASNNLYVLDSTNATGSNYTAYYQFINQPPGDYIIKAELSNGPASGTGPMPAYSYGSLYWRWATHMMHPVSISSQNIHLSQGMVTSGPGLISGNVSLGANKGSGATGVPAQHMLIFIGDVNNHLLAYTYTDANGHYSFSDLPIGFYVIYPEELNYYTIPHINVFVDNGHLIMNGISFHQNTISQTITPYIEAVNNIDKAYEVGVYPNPGSGIFNIVWNSQAGKNATITVSDVLGKTISTIETKEPKASINLSAMPAGVYYLHIRLESMNYTTKLVLKK